MTLKPLWAPNKQYPTISTREILNKIKNKEHVNAYTKMKESHTSDETTHIHFSRGIPQNYTGTIFIYSAGWKGGPIYNPYRQAGVGTLVAQRYIRKNILNDLVIAFDYPTDPIALFNIGQQKDSATLFSVYQLIEKYNPHAKIVFVGDCKGGTVILNLITDEQYHNKLSHLHAVLIESPPLSLQQALKHIAALYPFLGLYTFSCLNYISQWWLPAYKQQQKIHTILDAPAHCIPYNLPIFIGSITSDSIAQHNITQKIISYLQIAGNKHVYFFITNKTIRHAQISTDINYQNSANTFLKRHNLPHNTPKAYRGTIDLKTAHHNALTALET